MSIYAKETEVTPNGKKFSYLFLVKSSQSCSYNISGNAGALEQAEICLRIQKKCYLYGTSKQLTS